MHMGFCEGSHSLFDTKLMNVSLFQADKLEDFTGSVDKVCFFCFFLFVYLDKSLMGTQG